MLGGRAAAAVGWHVARRRRDGSPPTPAFDPSGAALLGRSGFFPGGEGAWASAAAGFRCGKGRNFAGRVWPDALAASTEAAVNEAARQENTRAVRNAMTRARRGPSRFRGLRLFPASV
ncbi:MAG: hypothetical protein QGG90_11525 [Nitrospinota bacterium]|nr:hypothetical protein [Nitrospinota bacterium]